MAKKLTSWKTKGMNKDLSVSAFNPEFSFENRNLRLSTNDGNTLLSWVNEKGTQLLSIKAEGTDNNFMVGGYPMGTAVLNHYLVLFTLDNSEVSGESTATSNRIYRLKYNDDRDALEGFLLYQGDLGFDIKCPIETLGSYEAEDVQKVYWTDGKNQPRVINIAVSSTYTSADTTQFDFVPELALQETVTVKKELGGGGTFAPGVIQYAFTYYRKYGQESNIFYTTPLYYISHYDRGAAPDEKVDNIFKITVYNVDTKFHYLRIYSIQRTSIDGTPIVKRIQDVDIRNLGSGVTTVHYTDTGTTGNSVDPTELLYKGGEEIAAGTMEQKDGTLFLGNIKLKRNLLTGNIKTSIQGNITNVGAATRTFAGTVVSNDSYVYANQLTSTSSTSVQTPSGTVTEIETVPCGGFKVGETYRLGVQFQHKSGKWSEPIPIKSTTAMNVLVSSVNPSINSNNITVPIFSGTLSNNNSLFAALANYGYKKVRPVIVFPRMADRTIVCQGVGCPAVATPKDLSSNFMGQSSWFFRINSGFDDDGDGTVIPEGSALTHLPYHEYSISQETGRDYGLGNANEFRAIEIEGNYDYDDEFLICNKTLTMHSPEVELDDQIATLDLTSVSCKYAGYVDISNTFSDINIQTETPTISNNGSGFVHKSFSKNSSHGIVAGLFYDDYIVDDVADEDDRGFLRYDKQKASAKWLVYPWESNRALNNDVTRPADKGVQSAKLKKKVISNLRFSGNSSFASRETISGVQAHLFDSDQNTIVKIGSKMYRGNIDTTLNPKYATGNYFAWSGKSFNAISGKYDNYTEDPTDFTSEDWCATYSANADNSIDNGIYGLVGGNAVRVTDHLGDDYVDLVLKKGGVRMKYKSSPHIVLHNNSADGTASPFIFTTNTMSIYELTKTVTNPFGGTSQDALRENTWVPCGKPKYLTGSSVVIAWEYGDTYYQRYDCLKTYAYTPEDVNQVVEIGSFMLETHINIDGRYDRNRGQLSNLNMSPQNFNLMNPVYSQIDNFFSYKIVSDENENTIYPNQITWSKTKESGADVDLWTNVTLASTMELDGDKGEVRKIARLNDQLLTFQDTGICQILYNESTQISTTQGVPIEIANSGKVQGKRYLSSTVGCSNKWSMVTTSMGIYFMDSVGKNIWLFNGQLENLSTQGGFNSWSKENIPPSMIQWNSRDFGDTTLDDTDDPGDRRKSAFVAYYDKQNQDVMFINRFYCLNYSEKFRTFTSFYSYENVPFFCSLDDTGIWVKASSTSIQTSGALWKHQAGDYGSFFNHNKSYGMLLIGNPEPQADKTFTNLEFRACVEGDGEEVEGRFTPYLPFDYLETWNEYQHGIALLRNMRGSAAMRHPSNVNVDDDEKYAALKRKFRMWRCDIPRDNADRMVNILDTFDDTFDFTFHDDGRLHKSVDRMRNPWLYLRLVKNAAGEGEVLPKAEIHDLVMTYYG